MRLPSYRLHKASGQAIVTIRGKDHYLGKYESTESRSKYDDLMAGYKRTVASVRAKRAKKEKDGPSYRLHSRSNQAVVTINGRDYYLGPYGSKESKAKYHRLKSEFIASGKSRTYGVKANDITIVELVADYVSYCKQYYGTGPESELHRSTPVLRVLKKLYGTEPAISFGPLQYEAVRVGLLDPYKRKRKDGKAGETRYRSRTYINSLMKRVRALFKWASSKSILPVSVLETLKTVEPLKAGRTSAPERGPVLPISDEIVEATLPHLNHVVRAMVEFQRLCGCRPGEVCGIKPSMVVDRSSEVWELKLQKHKTAYKGKSRTLYVGPKAQAILTPFLLRGADEYCFSPADAMKRVRDQRHAERTTPPNQGNRPGTNKKRKPAKKPGECYTTGSYSRSIRSACEANGIERWAPNRLRHSAGTQIRKQFGIEAAQVTLGHSELGVTQVYAEADRDKALEVARRIG
jgi:integrase